MKRILSLAIALVLPAGVLGQTVNVSVVGVVVKHPAKERAAHVPVALYCSATKGCSSQRVPGKSSHVPLGLYCLTKFQTTSTELYVLHEPAAGDNFFAKPVEVIVSCDRNDDHCIVQAADLELMPLTAARQDEGVAAVIRADWAAQSVRVNAGVITAAEAMKKVEKNAARIIGLTHWKGAPDKRLERIFLRLDDQPWKYKVPKLNIFEGSTDFMNKIKENPEFGKTKDIVLDGADLLKKKPLSPDVFQKWLLLPDKSISPDWFSRPDVIDPLLGHFNKMPKSKRPVFGFLDDKISVLPFLDDSMSPKAFLHLMEHQPQVRHFGLMQALKANPSLTDEQRRFLEDPALFPGPVLVMPRK